MDAEPGQRSGSVDWRKVAFISALALPGVVGVIVIAVTTGYWWLLIVAVLASASSAHAAHRAGKPFLPRHE